MKRLFNPETNQNAFIDGKVNPVAMTTGAAPGFGDSTFSERVKILHREFDELSIPQCEELMDFFSDQGWLVGSQEAFKRNLPLWMAQFVKILEYLRDHPSITSLYAVLRIWDDPVLDDIFHHMNETEFARTITMKKIGSEEIRLTRAAVNKAKIEAQNYFKTPLRHDDRPETSRLEMSNAQKKIWKPRK